MSEALYFGRKISEESNVDVPCEQSDIYRKSPGARVYVDVDVKFDRYGNMKPTALTWEDGRKYGIDRVLEVRPSFSAKAGGQGDLYLVKVCGSERHLYFERNTVSFSGSAGRWFVARNSV